MRRLRSVKIVATLGPASSTYEMIRALHEAGADVFRLNMSHGSHSEIAERHAIIRQVEKDLDSTIGILAAVEQRHRTGQGQHIDMSLLDCATALLANQAMNFLSTGTAPMRKGNDHPNISPYQVLPTKDGHIILAVGNDGQYQRLCGVLDRTDLGEDARFATNQTLKFQQIWFCHVQLDSIFGNICIFI